MEVIIVRSLVTSLFFNRQMICRLLLFIHFVFSVSIIQAHSPCVCPISKGSSLVFWIYFYIITAYSRMLIAKNTMITSTKHIFPIFTMSSSDYRNCLREKHYFKNHRYFTFQFQILIWRFSIIFNCWKLFHDIKQPNVNIVKEVHRLAI